MRVRTSESVRYALCDSRTWCIGKPLSTVIDGVAEYVQDDARSQMWRFAFYVRRADGTHEVVGGGGSTELGASEGNYSGGYGFGNAAKAYTDIPLRLIDWARKVAAERKWETPTNLKLETVAEWSSFCPSSSTRSSWQCRSLCDSLWPTESAGALRTC